MPSLSSSTRKRGLAVNAEAGASRSPADCAPQCLHVLVSHTSLTGSHTPHATSPTKQNQKHALVPPRELARLPMRRVSARESEERRAKARAQPPRGLYPAYVIPTLQLYCRCLGLTEPWSRSTARWSSAANCCENPPRSDTQCLTSSVRTGKYKVKEKGRDELFT